MKLGINAYFDFFALLGLCFSLLYVIISATTLFLTWKSYKAEKIDEIDISYKFTNVAVAYVVGYFFWIFIS